MAKGFVYLTAVVDLALRRVLAAKVAITLEACHATDVLQSVNYERVYLYAYESVLYAYESVTEARASIMQYMDWYYRSMPHSNS